ncbi:hypothetical protein QBC45DRAFT_428755 [Copromyces sp. CBS 386.78]|nr:hypothetical protein QBC45DRAFT_428755 [Copromyces sp. CBS 386.78]
MPLLRSPQDSEFRRSRLHSLSPQLHAERIRTPKERKYSFTRKKVTRAAQRKCREFSRKLKKAPARTFDPVAHLGALQRDNREVQACFHQSSLASLGRGKSIFNDRTKAIKIAGWNWACFLLHLAKNNAFSMPYHTQFAQHAPHSSYLLPTGCITILDATRLDARQYYDGIKEFNNQRPFLRLSPKKYGSSHQASCVPKVSKWGKYRDEDDLDEDERVLKGEEAKGMTSTQRRQLRNKVSARNFRARKKDTVGDIACLKDYNWKGRTDEERSLLTALNPGHDMKRASAHPCIVLKTDPGCAGILATTAGMAVPLVVGWLAMRPQACSPNSAVLKRNYEDELMITGRNPRRIGCPLEEHTRGHQKEYLNMWLGASPTT